MYNNFSSKKTKKVISALLATALVATSAPITADAAAAQTVGVGKKVTYNAKATVKSVSVKNKKVVTAKKSGKKVILTGKKAGKTTVTIKTTKKKAIKLTVKVGATSITKKTVATSMTAGQKKTLSVNAVNGKGDTIQFTSSNKAVVKVNKASATATAKKVASTTVTALKAGTAKITAKSKYTGKSKTFTIKVAAATVTPAPEVSTNPGVVATTPAATATVTNGPSVPGGNTTPTPQTTSGAATTAPGTSANPDETKNPDASNAPGESNAPSATDDANATATPDATTTPEVTTTPDVTTEPAVTATPSAIEFTAKQTGEKKIVITNPTAMTKADISIKRGSTEQTINDYEFDTNATTATLTLAGSIVAVEYTVTVGDNTVKFTGEASKVTDIQITSDSAPVVGEIGSGTAGESDTAIANYAVFNQFGENVTAKTSLTANTSAKGITLNPTEGTMTITWAQDPRLNDVVSVVLMHQESGLSVSKILTVQTKSAPASVETYGIYNADGKTLTATNVSKESFYYLFRVKDQYGNYMSSVVDTNGGGSTQNFFPTVSSGMTNVELDTTNRQTLTIDGVNYFAYPVQLKDASKPAVAGNVTVMLIPGGSGKTVTTEFEVANGSTVKSLSIMVDSAVAKNGKKTLNYVALDENGDEVTEYRVLKQVTSSSSKFYWQKANGKVNLVFDDTKGTASTAGTAVSTVFTLPSYETKLVSVNIGEPSVVASISGLNKDLSLATRAGDDITIDFDDINIVDQYGNSIATTGFASVAASASDGEYGIMLVEEDENNKIFKKFGTTAEVSGDSNTYANALTSSYKDGTNNAYIIGSSESFTLTPNVASLLGTESFTFKLVKWDNTAGKWVDYESSYTTSSQVNFTQTGAFTSTFTVTEDKRFVSYKITAPDVIYDTNDSDYAGYVTVKGVLNNGQTVDLHAGTDFKVVKGENLIEDAASPSNVQPGAGVASLVENNLLVPGSAADTVIAAATYGDGSSVTGKYKVVINYTGETTEKTVTICKDAPTTKTIKFNGTQTGINIPQSESSNDVKDGFNSVDGGNVDQADGANAIKLMMAELEAKDSYGVVAGSNAGGIDTTGLITLENDATTEQIKITVTDIDSINGTVSDNGTENISFANFVAGDSFTVTFTAGSASFTTVVSIQ